MSQDARDVDQEVETLIKETSDAALEAAAHSGPFAAGCYTLAMCTGQAECPF